MPDYRSLFDSDYLANWDLDKDTTVQITKVEVAEIASHNGDKERRPLVYFKSAKKAMVLNKTNGKLIAGMYGPNTDDWRGKRITLYPTTCEAFGDTVGCIRVRPKVPK